MLFNILILLFISLFPQESRYIFKLKAITGSSVRIINNTYVTNPNEIYIDSQIQQSNQIILKIDNSESEIKLIWFNKLTTCNSMFSTLTYITEIDFSQFDSSDVTDMQHMFDKCTSLKNINFCNFNTTNVKDMKYMFANCTSLTSLDVSNFQTSKVENMEAMFYACYSLKSLDISKLNTQSSINFNFLFKDCYNLKFLNLNGINTQSSSAFIRMFDNCYSLKSLDLSNIRISSYANALSLRYMFYNCSSLTSLDISNFQLNTQLLFIDFMFAECKNLGYLNIQNLNEQNIKDESYYLYDNILDNTPNNMVACFTPSKASNFSAIFSTKSCGVIDCSTNWKQKQNKINGETLECIGSCSGTYLYDYLNRCYKQYPEGTTETGTNSCEEIIIEEKENLNISKCISLYPEKEKEKELLSEEKEEENKKEEKDKEIEKEHEETDEKEKIKYSDYENKNDYDYHEIIEEEIYKDSYVNYETEKNTEIIDIKISSLIIIDTSRNSISNNIFNIINISNINSLSHEKKDEFVADIIKKIQDGTLDALLSTVINGGENFIIKNEEETYSISTTESQSFNETRSLIDLGDCEKELKKVYNLSEEEKIIMFKIERFNPDYIIPIVAYELFSQKGNINFDMDYCNNIKINTYIAAVLDEKDLNKYNPEDKYYNDRCQSHTSENGTDITIYDRKKEYNENNMSLCEANCEYEGYDINNKVIECECSIKSLKNFFGNKKQLLNEFKNVKKIMNLDLIKCYKSLLSIKGLKNNIGSYIILSFIIISIFCSLLFCLKGYNSLINLINPFTKKNKKGKLKTGNFEKNKKDNNNNKITHRQLINHIQEENIINQNNILTLNNTNNTNNKNKHKFNSNKNKNNNDKKNKKIRNQNKKKKKKKFKKKMKLNDNEMNSLSYGEALEYDKRNFFEYYISLIKTKQIIIFYFFIKSDYNSSIIKIIVFFLSLAFFYFINALFFTDSTMHQIYVDHGVYNFLYQLPQIIYSTIISTIIETIISYLSLTEDTIIELKRKKLKEKIDESKKLIKCIFNKFIIFFILNYLFLGFIWYYLSSFCSVYKNTQVFLLKDTLISFAVSLVYPFFYNFIPTIFRISALKAKNRNFLYKLSRLLEKF